MWLSNYPRNTVKKLPIFHLTVTETLLKTNSPKILGFNWWTLNSIPLFYKFNLMPALHCLDCCSFIVSFEAVKCLLFSFFKIVLAILNPLSFLMNLNIIFSMSIKNSAEILMWIALNLCINFCGVFSFSQYCLLISDYRIPYLCIWNMYSATLMNSFFISNCFCEFLGIVYVHKHAIYKHNFASFFSN